MTYMCFQETKKLSNNFENFQDYNKAYNNNYYVFAIAPYQTLC